LSLVRTKAKIRSISNPSESETPMTLRIVLGSLLITIISSAPPIASAAPSSACTKADYLEGRKQFTKLYRAGQFAESVEALIKIKQNCWDILDATDRGWLISDLTLGAGKAGRPDLCRQLAATAPKELDPESRVAKAIHFNEEHCEDKPAADAAKPAQADGSPLPVVAWPALGVASAADATKELAKTWEVGHKTKKGRSIRRCSDIGRAKPNDMEVEFDRDYDGLLAVWLRCRALEIVSQGKPAARGYVRELLTMKNPGNLLPPVMALELVNEDDAIQKAAMRAGKSWREFVQNLSFEPDDERPQQLWVSGDDFGGHLEWWAAGDFDGDGFDDIIVFRALGPEEGTLLESKAFVLTRTNPKGVLKVVKKL
jgi:hypothetical protein